MASPTMPMLLRRYSLQARPAACRRRARAMARGLSCGGRLGGRVVSARGGPWPGPAEGFLDGRLGHQPVLTRGSR